MARTITIEVTGEGGKYEAMIQRITDKTNSFTRDAQRGAQQTNLAITSITQGLSSMQQALIGAFSVGAISAFLRSALSGVSVLQDLSEQTGISARNLAVLRLAGIATGQGVDEVATGVVKLQRTLIESRSGIDPMNKGLLQLKLSSNEFNAALADPNELIAIFARRLAEIPNQAERNAVAMELAG